MAKQIKNASFKDFVRIERLTNPVVDFDAVPATWETFIADVPCNVEPTRGNETVNAQQGQSLVTHEVTMRYEDGILESMRVIFEDGTERVLHIAAVVDPHEDKRWLVLECVERTT